MPNLHMLSVNQNALTTLPAGLGKAASTLWYLFANDNEISSLPDALAGLTQIGMNNMMGFPCLDLGNNKICSVSDTLKTWLTKYDPDWNSTQSWAPLDKARAVTVRSTGVAATGVGSRRMCMSTGSIESSTAFRFPP